MIAFFKEYLQEICSVKPLQNDFTSEFHDRKFVVIWKSMCMSVQQILSVHAIEEVLVKNEFF